MSKPNSGRARKAQPELPRPDQARPAEGGSYIRDKETGELTRIMAEVPADPVEAPPVDAPPADSPPAEQES